jgi:2-polyprenyl-6-methoxyphenol hydroxylase-like FAD-dependent oxidoreductase
VVCGGGPAGSTFATLLSRKGHRVILFERERFPRFHIGESLLPWNIPLLQRVGVLDKVRSAGMQVKLGARFYHQGTDRVRPVQFVNGIDKDHPSAFQVKRADFDKLLLDHACESGAQVFEGPASRKCFSAKTEGGRAASACALPERLKRASLPPK